LKRRRWTAKAAGLRPPLTVMINTTPSPSCPVADWGAHTSGDVSPRRTPLSLSRPGFLEPQRLTRPPACSEAGTGRACGALPAELVRRIAEHLPLADAAHYAQVDRDTHQALAEFLTSQRLQQQQDRQRHLVALCRQARTPDDLLAVVQQIPALPESLQEQPLEAAGHQLGRSKSLLPGDADAAVFRAVWQAIITLPVPLRRKPLFAIAGQVAVLPVPQRLAAMKDALAQMQQCPSRASSYSAIKAWTRGLPQLPLQQHAAGLRLVLDGPRPILPFQRREFRQLLSDTVERLDLSPPERELAWNARMALAEDAPNRIGLKPPSAASTATPRPAWSPPTPP